MWELVKGGERYKVDFKKSVPSTVKEISDEVAGFANSEGGYVLIGVDNNNQIMKWFKLFVFVKFS